MTSPDPFVSAMHARRPDGEPVKVLIANFAGLTLIENHAERVAEIWFLDPAKHTRRNIGRTTSGRLIRVGLTMVEFGEQLREGWIG